MEAEYGMRYVRFTFYFACCYTGYVVATVALRLLVGWLIRFVG